MESSKKLYRRYLISGIGILVLFITVNLLLVFGGGMLIARGSVDDEISLKTLISDFTQTTDGIEFGKNSLQLLSDHNSWAMLLDDTGTIISSACLPEELNHSYTTSEVAMFTRWYINDYPVLVEVSDYGLLVVGYPKNSMDKHNLMIDSDIKHLIIFGIPTLFLINILLVFILYWQNLRQVEKATSPIITGIKRIAAGKENLFASKKSSSNQEIKEIQAALTTLNEQLHNKEQARAEWINGVSHDIRTPLSMIMGYSSELEENRQLPDKVREQGRIIRTQSEKIKNLIADLNLTSRLEYSMQPLRAEIYDLAELARQVIIDFYNSGLNDCYEITFECNTETQSFSAKGDTSLIKRMIYNVLQNAIVHNPAGCHIAVILTKEPIALPIKQSHKKSCNPSNDVTASEVARFTVCDNGVGMSKELLMQSANSECNYSENGEPAHGFGLKLVRQIVKSHHGSILFEENSPCGLAVTILLPLDS